MRTGICTTDFEKGKLLPADKLFGIIRSMGFECLQFAFTSIAECDCEPSKLIEIPANITGDMIRAAVHASEKYSLPVEVINGTFNMAHPDAWVRDEGLLRLEKLIIAAGELGAKYISLCSGTRNRNHLWRYSDENDTPDAWDDMYSAMSRAVEIAERYSITLAIESEASNVIDTPENARRVMDQIGSDRLKMILDCANLFHVGEAHRENVKVTISHAFAVYGDDIVIAHGKDIREGESIDFCGTGLGIVDFAYTAELLRERNYTGDMFLHGIYDIDDMPRALEHWKDAAGVV